MTHPRSSADAIRRAMATATAATLALAVVATASPLAAQEGVALPVGTLAPDATVEDLEGTAVSLLDVAGVTSGRPALIEFWASWCEQCEALQPQLDAVRHRYAGEVGVVAVAVAVAQSRRRVRRHVEQHSPGYPYVYDAGGEAVRAYRALTTSIVVLVDAEGRIAYAGTGPDQDLVNAVAAMLDAVRSSGPARSPGPARTQADAGYEPEAASIAAASSS